MSSTSVNSVNRANSTGGRRRHTHEDFDRRDYPVGQSLVTAVNDPRAVERHTLFQSLGLTKSNNTPQQISALDPVKYPPIHRQDLENYLKIVKGKLERFDKDRQRLQETATAAANQQHDGPKLSSGEGLVYAMQHVPMQYFEEDFSLHRPEILQPLFDCPYDEDILTKIEELSGHLDIVELQIHREIVARSQSFFDAAGSLQELRMVLCDSLDHIKSLRQQMGEVDGQTYRAAVSIARLQRRRRNKMAVLEHMKGLEHIVAAQSTFQLLLEQADFAGALELLRDVQQQLEGQGGTGVQCFRHLPPQLVESIGLVEQLLAREFLSVCRRANLSAVIDRILASVLADHLNAESQQADEELREQRASANGNGLSPADSISSANGNASNGDLASPTAAAPKAGSKAALGGSSGDELREQLMERLVPVVIGLHRAEKLTGAVVVYREIAVAEAKEAVKAVQDRLLPMLLQACGDLGVTPGDIAQGDAQLGEKLQMLHHDAFMQLLRGLAQAMETCIQHSNLLARIIADILTTQKVQRPVLTALQREATATTQQIVDVAQHRWVKLMGTRTNVHSRLKLYEFKALTDTTDQFAAYAEALGARTVPAFKSAVQGQCKAFLESVHQRSLLQMQHLQEAEQWVVVDVPRGFQQIVDRLIARCSASGASVGVDFGDTSTPALGDPHGSDGHGREGQTDTQPAGSSGRANGGGEGTEAATAVLQLCGKRFHMVNCSLMLLKQVDEYLALFDVVPAFGAEIANKTLEILKAFNTRTCQLVLGAGAMKTAGLKSISAKHLAMSCQSLTMLTTLHPLLRAALLSMVSAPRKALLLPDFDHLLQDLTTHVEEIHVKLVDIMQDRLVAAVRQLQAESESWGLMSHLAESEPTEVIRTLTKQLGTLNAVLAPLMLPWETAAIFGRVASLYSETLADGMDGLQARGDAWETRRKANTLHVMRSFRELPLDPARISSFLTRLSSFYTKHYGLPPEDVFAAR